MHRSIVTQAYHDVMMMDGRSGDGERRTTLTLTVAQLTWVKVEAARRRCTQNDVIEQALIQAGAPAPEPVGAD